MSSASGKPNSYIFFHETGSYLSQQQNVQTVYCYRELQIHVKSKLTKWKYDELVRIYWEKAINAIGGVLYYVVSSQLDVSCSELKLALQISYRIDIII